MKHKSILALLAILTLTSSVGFAQDNSFTTDNFDQNVRAQDDLYRFVNGTWLREKEIPSDKSNFGSFTVLADLSQERIKNIIEESSKTEHPKGSDAQKVGDLYRSFMNEELAESKGISPVEPHLDQIRALNSHDDLSEFFGKSQKIGIGSPIGFFVSQDAKDSSRYIVQMIQSGTSLPDRDYYLDEENEVFAKAREAFKTYIAKLFDLAGIEDGETAATQILELETKLAKAQWARVVLRQAEKRYNLHTIPELKALAPNFNWDSFFAATNVGEFDIVNVMTPSFFEEASEIFKATPLDVWKRYLQFHAIDGAASLLSKSYVDAHFEFHDKELSGTPEQKPRWKRGVELVAGAGARSPGMLGEVLGRIFVEKHFPPESKARMDQLVKNLLSAFGDSIDGLSWMTAETKEKAKEKLSKINTKIGYPSKWKDYSKLSIEPDDLVGNAMRSAEVEYNRMIEKLGQPVDRDEWGMTPQTVNAYYNPALNEIVFPAAILQPPFFSANAPDPLNYGGIGAVIGHEISHAFDDQGSKYDGDGNLKNWWTDDDRAAFEKLTQQLINQYSEYSPLPGKFVNGEFTLGENIADLSGLEIANKAMKISFAQQKPEKFAGFEPEQLFFVGWSRVWARKYRDSEMEKRLKGDPHSPSEFRANGPVMNIDAFYEAFNVKEGDRLFKPLEERIKIW